jgi:hypothetical protein
MDIPPETLREGRNVFVALPWYKSASPLTTFSLLAMADRTRMAFGLGFGDAFIAHSRNKLATQFVDSTLEWMLMVDDDMVLPFGDANWFNGTTGFKLDDRFAGLHTLNRLLSHGKTIAGAMYFGRWKAGHPVFAEGRAMEKLLRSGGPRDEVRPTRWVGTGTCLMHRSVFLDIEREFPQLSRAQNNGVGQWFTSSEHDLDKAVTQIIERGELQDIKQILKELELARAKSKVNSVHGIGEDVQFCIRATQAGHQPYVDLALWCGHAGSCIFPLR